MQPAPALAFDADDGGLARAGIAALVGLAAAVTAHGAVQWLAVMLDGPSAAPWAGAVLAAVAAVLMAMLAARWQWRRSDRAPVRLRWDTRQWHWQAPGDVERAGRLRVALDLGPWMLLAFDPERPPGTPAWRLPLPGSRRWVALGQGAADPARAVLYAAPPLPRTAA